MKNVKEEAKEIMFAARTKGFELVRTADEDNTLELLYAIKEVSNEKSVVRYLFDRAPKKEYTDEQRTQAVEIINEMNTLIRRLVSEAENEKKDINKAMIEIIKNKEPIRSLKALTAITITCDNNDTYSVPEVSTTRKITKFFEDDKVGTEAEWVNKNPNFTYIYGGCYLNKTTKMIEYLYHRRHDRLFHIGFVEHDKKTYEVYADNRFIGTIAKNWSYFKTNGDSDSNFFLTGIQRSMEKIAVSEMQEQMRATTPDPFFN